MFRLTLSPVLPVGGDEVGGMNHDPQSAVLVEENHHLGVVGPVRVLGLDPHSPQVGIHLAQVWGGELRVLSSVQEDQGQPLCLGHLVVHHHPLQVHHEVDL